LISSGSPKASLALFYTIQAFGIVPSLQPARFSHHPCPISSCLSNFPHNLTMQRGVFTLQKLDVLVSQSGSSKGVRYVYREQISFLIYLAFSYFLPNIFSSTLLSFILPSYPLILSHFFNPNANATSFFPTIQLPYFQSN